MPVHEVSIGEGFYASTSEISVAQYRSCVVQGVCEVPEFAPGCHWELEDNDDLPINCISWSQARTFARWIGGELPSESQWEYFAHGRAQNVGGGFGPSCVNSVIGRRVPDVNGCGYAAPEPICFLGPQTVDGLCDVIGNVKEWVLDGYGSYQVTPRDERPYCVSEDCALEAQRILRGGSYATTTAYDASFTYRRIVDAESGAIEIGLRVVRRPPLVP